jgi:hypothetical protein
MKKCMKCGGTMKVGGTVKKMSKGGFAPAQKGGDNTKMGIYGIPNAGGTGPETMKKGGSVKKMSAGTSKPVQKGCPTGYVRKASGIGCTKMGTR